MQTGYVYPPDDVLMKWKYVVEKQKRKNAYYLYV
jgi:hypothetical protein